MKSVLDLTCGTGSQVFWLADQGYDVVGSDINAKMLSVAKGKAKARGLKNKFVKADMCEAKIGNFDAVITIFNAVGHLTKADFVKAIRNIHNNLNDGGLYIFDIFNLEFLLAKDNITRFTIDWFKRIDDRSARVIQYSTIDETGIMASFTTEYEQKPRSKTKVRSSVQTLQVYSASQLRELLGSNGFSIVQQCAVDGVRFDNIKTDRIFTVAKRTSIAEDKISRSSSRR